jgi:hypothetical protein
MTGQCTQHFLLQMAAPCVFRAVHHRLLHVPPWTYDYDVRDVLLYGCRWKQLQAATCHLMISPVLLQLPLQLRLLGGGARPGVDHHIVGWP